MANLPPNDPRPPRSPDSLDGGVRGRISGVTRVGPRAFAAAFIVVCGLLIAILYGLNKGSSSNLATVATATQLPVQPSDEPRFGAGEPIVATAPPATAPPPLLIPPTSVPNLDNQDKSAAAPAAPAPAAPAPEDPAIARRESAENQARLDEEKRQRELRLAALRSPILTGDSANQGGGTNLQPGATAMQLAFAGTGDGSTGFAGSDGSAPNATTASLRSGAGTGTGSGIVSTRSASAPAASTSDAKPDSGNAYLNGPSGQYGNVQSASNVVLPPGANPKDFLQAQRFAPVSPFEITAGSVLPAALITGIDSELPGLLSAQIREDIYDTKTGRYLLVPRGAKLVGLYKSDVSFGQSRILVAWTRLIFPDTTSIDLQDMPGSDVGGFAGLGGIVDNNYGRIFSAAILTSIIAAGLELSQPQQTSILTNPSAGQAVSQAVGQQLAQTSTQIISKNLNIPPKIYVAKGYPFLVTVDRDIVLPGAYRGAP